MGNTSEYNRQQLEAWRLVRSHLAGMPAAFLRRLEGEIGPYLEFREAVALFQEEHLAGICTIRCFSDRTSDCCGREGMLTFFADVVVNALLSGERQIDILIEALEKDRGGDGCVYLGDEGCLWRLKPIVCEMFLCDQAKKTVFEENEALRPRWEDLRRRERIFTYPDRPVLFDDLERLFIEEGHESPLMYFHRSPGLVRLKRKHGMD